MTTEGLLDGNSTGRGVEEGRHVAAGEHEGV